MRALFVGRHIPIAGLALSALTPAEAQLTRADLTLSDVTFTLNNGAAVAADRDVTWKFTFSGSTTVLYRMAEGAAPTSGWLIGSSGTVTGQQRLVRGPESLRTLYLEIRRNAESPIVRRTASVELRYPKRDHAFTDPDFSSNAPSNPIIGLFDAATTAGYGFTRRKLVGHNCIYRFGVILMMAEGGLPSLPSGEAVCEFKMMSGKLLAAGWTLKAASVGRWGGHPNGSCLMQTIVAGTNTPTITLVVKHPGALIPDVGNNHSTCKMKEIVFTGPDDPDHTETGSDIFRPPSGA